MKRSMKSLPSPDRPREKLLRSGAGNLSDEELIQIIIGSGVAGADVISLSKKVRKLLIKGLDTITLENLCQITGIKTATATKLLASLELARRHVTPAERRPITKVEHVLAHVHDIRFMTQEHLVALFLDGGHRFISRQTIAIGTRDRVMAHPREIFTGAIAQAAAAIILVHNHPSGKTEPSDEDIALTQRIDEAGRILGVSLLEHFIVTHDDFEALKGAL